MKCWLRRDRCRQDGTAHTTAKTPWPGPVRTRTRRRKQDQKIAANQCRKRNKLAARPTPQLTRWTACAGRDDTPSPTIEFSQIPSRHQPDARNFASESDPQKPTNSTTGLHGQKHPADSTPSRPHADLQLAGHQEPRSRKRDHRISAISLTNITCLPRN